VGISTHILDTTLGRPAAGVAVTLEREEAGAWHAVGNGVTDPDGRVKQLLLGTPHDGTYRITFAVDGYFKSTKTEAFYPVVTIQFRIKNAAEHYHVPLLLNPFGYSTYRGS
jgi:5-hydroxyisourate hydrolase